ncbi:MAG: DUF1553 domain-containing protein [Verrucomicrobiales bacterium]|nr:DUF1553 domain-containing protein [Verrucomicrobiales bacterium]
MTGPIEGTRTFLFCITVQIVVNSGLLASVPSAEALAFFESRIRPVLAEHCFECHGSKNQQGGLRLDSRAAIFRGGENGPALLTGQSDESRFIQAVKQLHPRSQAPRQKRLTARQVAELTEWIKAGALWPTENKTEVRRRQRAEFEITEKDRAYWAFQTVHRPLVPKIANRKSQIANPVDAFVLAELDKKGIQPNPPATKRELIRRAYFDLIGLPPSYEQVRAFEQDASPDAYERLLDLLLSLPQYGERWGRHWLDVVRFAQSTGYERDAEKPLAWRYRDYVIKAFNEDKPYDQFIKEQLAGDELPNATRDAIVATGFYRLGVYDDEPADKQMAVFDEFDDYVVTTGAAFLGLTLGCARCHDHKFDPIPQSDYYSLLAFFRGIRGYDGEKITLDGGGFVPLAEAAQVRHWQEELASRLKPLEDKLTAAKAAVTKEQAVVKTRQTALTRLDEQVSIAADDGVKAVLLEARERLQLLLKESELLAQRHTNEQKTIQEQIDRIKAEKPPWDWALAVREVGAQPEPTHILVRGNPLSPGPEVQPGVLTVLGGEKPSPAAWPADATSSGRRRLLAEWIASSQNPLTARVLVNRAWKHHFGHGLVRTTLDFGRAGTPPTHPQLLDWLAAEFIDRDWSIKSLHKIIMLSDTYCRSSNAANEQAASADPANDLLWRQNLHRLEAEAIRDTILSVSGRLNLKAGGRGFFPRLAGEVIAGASRPGLDWEISSEDEQARRSVYTFIKRTLLVPSLQSFDYSTTDSPLGERPTTTVAPQALMLLNDSFMEKQAVAFAERLRRESGENRSAQVRRAYQLALSREPSPRETGLALALIDKQARAFEQTGRRITFRPDVPESIYNAYQDKLRVEDHLVGPRELWTYHRGRWSKDYEGIRTVDRARGPFALWSGADFADGVIEAKLTLHRAAEFASLLFGAGVTNEVQRGYEVVLDARQQRIALRRHATNTITLAETSSPIRSAGPHELRVEAREGSIRVWLDGSAQPLLAVHDSSPARAPGRVGVRAWGAAVSVDALTLDTGRETIDVLARSAGPWPKSPSQRALESFCLMMLNLNELVYVD